MRVKIYETEHKTNERGIRMIFSAIKDPCFIGRSANVMSRSLIEKEFNGPGDTIDAAAYRLQTKRGIDANIVLQGWNRNLAGKGMDARRWLPLFVAWVDAVYSAEREKHENDAALLRLADLVAGASDIRSGEKNDP